MLLSPRLMAAALGLLAAGCVGVQDSQSTVHDLRVLGVSLEPPELMASACPKLGPNGFQLSDLSALAAYASPVSFRALVADPHGEDRNVSFELVACGNQGDYRCANGWERVPLVENDSFQSANGVDAEVQRTLRPGLTFLDGGATGAFADAGVGEPLLLQVVTDDPYHGLGGFLMPLSLHLTAEPPPDAGTGAGREEIYAQKLMVFSCPFFPDMKPNVTPVLQGFTLDDVDWPEDGIPTRKGSGPFHVVAKDVSALEESYSVVDFGLQEVHLKESWKIDYYTTLGTFSPEETGGVDLGGNEDPHSTGWSPGSGATEQIVTFWFTVRDGRGGFSWTKRLLHYIP